MQVVILAGGFGTRLSEETDFIPKPMVQIGQQPILQHIINYYSQFGHQEFLIALGYKADIVFNYFEGKDSKSLNSHLSIKLIDTGLDTATGGRIKILEKHLEQEFLMTYGDGLSNVDLHRLVDHHRKFGKMATVTAVKPPARFGALEISNGMVTRFAEKSPQDAGWINGGFFCLNRDVCSLINGNGTSFESEPMNELVRRNELTAFEHLGWWQPMDTLRDKRSLEALYESGSAPWI